MPQDKLKTKAVEEMLDVFAQTTDPEEVFMLLEDLCTVREITEMSQRLQVAKMLAEGASYIEIQDTTGASATTISRVSKCLNYGSGGYRMVVERHAGAENETER